MDMGDLGTRSDATASTVLDRHRSGSVSVAWSRTKCPGMLNQCELKAPEMPESVWPVLPSTRPDSQNHWCKQRPPEVARTVPERAGAS